VALATCNVAPGHGLQVSEALKHRPEQPTFQLPSAPGATVVYSPE
jgi:hypothetical protein